tara:strand:- start:392 stop:988 length:597 start_codon:yes stop_codon:yes gene_type:complete
MFKKAKKLFLIFYFSFFFHSLTYGDNINDFKMEGLSIGDSLLNFFSKDQIDKFINYDVGTDLKFRISEFSQTNNFVINNYDVMQVYYKPNDKNYLISGVRGALFCESKDDCLKQQKKIIDDLKNTFSNFNSPKKEKFKHPDDQTGKSIVDLIFLKLDKGYITVRYTDWSDNMTYSDNIDVEIGTTEVEKWLRSNYGKN